MSKAQQLLTNTAAVLITPVGPLTELETMVSNQYAQIVNLKQQAANNLTYFRYCLITMNEKP